MVAAIAAVDINWGIGYKGDLLDNIPEDRKFFREKTKDSIVIMGRKTWDSLPIKPLPNRTNYIISRSTFPVGGDSHVITLEEAIHLIQSTTNEEKVFVIGGEKIYSALLPYCDTAYITKIHDSYTADTYFPNLDKLKAEWKMDEIVNPDIKEYPIYQFITYKRRNRC